MHLDEHLPDAFVLGHGGHEQSVCKHNPGRCTFGIVARSRLGPMASCSPPAKGKSMGRFFDFAKRRIAGYIVFWILVFLFVGWFYNGDPPAQAAGLFVPFLPLGISSHSMASRSSRRRVCHTHPSRCSTRVFLGRATGLKMRYLRARYPMI